MEKGMFNLLQLRISYLAIFHYLMDLMKMPLSRLQYQSTHLPTKYDL